MSVTKIVSGGQTGADRGALDAALALGIPHGGWCPKGRIAEDGRVPDRYALVETQSTDYNVRTRLNVQDADATVIFVVHMTPGSMTTSMWCRQLGKPHVVIANVVAKQAAALERLLIWLWRYKPKTLNVAGSRESRAPGIAGAVERIMFAALKR